jgi:23S rRNA A1618 N6-methylase RlmF
MLRWEACKGRTPSSFFDKQNEQFRYRMGSPPFFGRLETLTSCKKQLLQGVGWDQCTEESHDHSF